MVTPPERFLTPRLVLAFLTMMLIGGISNAFTVFLPPLLAEFGGSRAGATVAMTLLWVCGAVLGPVAGRLVDRWNPRLVVAIGLCLTAAGLALATRAATLRAFALTLGLLGGAGVGLTGMVTQSAVIAGTYERRRGFAVGTALAGAMVGYALAAPAHWSIVAFGWRATLVGWGAVVLGMVPVVLRHYPTTLGARPATGGDARATAPAPTVSAVVRGLPFWSLAVMYMLGPLLGYLCITLHALYFPAIGFSANEAAAMLVAGGVLATLGRALTGLAADRFGAVAVGMASLLSSALGALCLIGLEAWPIWPLAGGYVVFMFAPLGSRATIATLLGGRIAPPGRFGTVFGLLTTCNNVGAAAGPLLAGAMWDLTRSYLALYVTAFAMALVGLGALVTFVRASARRAL